MPFDVSRILQDSVPAKEMTSPENGPRTAETIGSEIRYLSHQAKCMTVWFGVEIGKRLAEAKAMVGHGGWLDFLKNETEFSKSSAARFMQIAKEYGNNSNFPTLGNLSVSNALQLLAVPAEEREEFAEAVDAENLSARELEQAIRERDEARKQLEAERAASEGTALKLADITSALDAEKEKTEKIRREFTANVSHELKTPLTTISGYAQMISNGMAKAEDIKEFGRKIEKESDRLLTLIDDIINLSNIDEQGSIENPENIDLSLVTEEAICVLEKAAKERGIQIYYTKIPTFIKGNVTLVSELVYNLLDNAIKYNKDNGKITVFVGESAKGVELSVKDTGIGIPPEDTERIFERFYRVDKSHSKKVGGTGLGLSIVKHVCACHNATIRVKSKVGKGTTIYVTFPNNVNN